MDSIETLTEHEAIVVLAEAWNRLDPCKLIDLMASDVHYCSQRVLEELTTKESVSEFLQERMRLTAENVTTKPNVKVFAELGKTDDLQECDCVVIAQGTQENIVTVVFLKVEGNRIKRIDLCVPQFRQVVRSGVYPGRVG
jgi:hypothetical protein